MNDYYSLIGVSRDATAGEIAIAYRQMVRQRYEELGGEANLGELSRAYRVLSSIEQRRVYDRLLLVMSGKHVLADPANPTEAENSYQAGVEAMEAQNYQDAVNCFARAVELAPETGHFHSQLGLALGMFRDRLAEAEQCCKKAVELEPDNPELFYNLGFLYQRHNLNEAAQEAFSQAQDALAARQARYQADIPGIIAMGSPGEQSALVYSGTASGPGRTTSADAGLPAGDLLKELESLESTLDDQPPATVDMPAAAEPVAAASADDLLKELESIEAEVGQTGAETGTDAVAPAAPAPAPKPKPEPTPVPEPAAAVENEPAPAALSVDDLLRELAAMEEQVNQTEELHNGPAAEPEPAVIDAFTPTVPDVPDIYQETQLAEYSNAIEAQANELLEGQDLRLAPLPAAPEPATPALAEPAAVAPAPQPAAALPHGGEHVPKVDPEVQKKVKQLDALESEMEEELQRIRLERQKLLGSAT